MNYIRATPTRRHPCPLWHIERQGKPACRVTLKEPDRTTEPPKTMVCPSCTQSLHILRKLGKL